MITSAGAVDVYDLEHDSSVFSLKQSAFRALVPAASSVSEPVLLFGSDVLSIMQPGFSTMAGVVKVRHPSTSVGGVSIPEWFEFRSQPHSGVSVSVSSSSSSVTDTRIISSSSINLRSDLNTGVFDTFYGLCTDPLSYPVTDVENDIYAFAPDYFPISLDLSQFGDFYSFTINGLITAHTDFRDVSSGSYYDLANATSCKVIVNGAVADTFYADSNGTFDFAYYEYDSDQLITSIVLEFQCYLSPVEDYSGTDIIGRFILESEESSEIQFFSDIGLKTYRQSVLDYLSNLLLVPGVYLGASGSEFTSTSSIGFGDIMALGLRGIASVLNSFYSDFLAKAHISVSSPYLTSNGVSVHATYPVSFSALLSNGFLGLSYTINGTRSVRDYSGSLIDNQNLTSTFSATGLGPMLQRYLEEIQHDSGLLTYIFASPEDIEMKENSSSSMSAVNDSFIDPDSDTSVSVSDIGTLSSAAGSIESFGATGVTPDQAFAQLGNDSIFDFFSQTTADNLDSRPSSYSFRDPAPQIVTNYYSESRTEFFNLIGEGSE